MQSVFVIRIKMSLFNSFVCFFSCFFFHAFCTTLTIFTISFVGPTLLLLLPPPPSQHISDFIIFINRCSHFHAIILPLWLFIFDFGHFSYVVVVVVRSSFWHFSFIHFDFDLFAKEQNKNLSFYYLPSRSCSHFVSFGINQYYVICNHIEQG